MRKERGWTAAYLADKLELNPATVAKYELGVRFPSYDALENLARTFDCSVDYIMGISDDPTPIKDATNIREFLNKTDLHWNGIRLSTVEIFPLRELLSLLMEAKQKADIDHIDRVEETRQKIENHLKTNNRHA